MRVVPRSRHRCPPPRRGFTMFELVMSTILLAVAMTTTVQILGWVAHERRAADRRQWAVQEVANLMERWTAEPWDRVNDGSARELALSGEIRRKLRRPELSATVDEVDDRPEAKRLSIQLRWPGRSGEWETPVRLTAWIYRREVRR